MNQIIERTNFVRTLFLYLAQIDLAFLLFIRNFATNNI